MSNFERRITNGIDPDTIRAFMSILHIEDQAGDEAREETREETREEWPAVVKVFLDVMGLFLSAKPADERLQLMRDITRQIVRR